MTRGRPVEGPKAVDSLPGTEDAKTRLRVILETVSGVKGIDQACAELGLGRSAFYELRMRVLRASLEELEPKSAGRPRLEISAEQQEIARLKQDRARLINDLRIAHVREEIMLAMPQVFEPAKAAVKKKGRPRIRRGRIT